MLAKEVAKRLDQPVTAASLLHSHRIDASELDGIPAKILEQQLVEALEAGEREFLVIPLFFGPSRALTEYIPAVVARLEKRFGAVQMTVARPLVEISDPSSVEAVGRMLEWGIEKAVAQAALGGTFQIVLVDHGTPEPRVNEVRNVLASYLSQRAVAGASGVTAASMERRPEPEYAFNEPLLETVLRDPAVKSVPVVLSYLFLQPGRHAGAGGDIAAIVEEARAEDPSLRVIETPLVAECPALPELLARRARSELE